MAGDFQQFLAGVALFGVWRHLAERKKALILWTFCDTGVSYPKVERMPGWRRSGIRTSLQRISLLTGNLTGKIAKLVPDRGILQQETC